MKKSNNVGQYASRAAKHFLKLTVLMALLFGVMILTDTLAVGPRQLLGYRGAILLVAMVGISLAYPLYGFMSVRLQASLSDHRREIMEAMAQSGYTLHSEEEGVMIFRASGVWKRLVNVGDEALTLRQAGEGAVELSGVRKEVENARFRIAGRIGRGEF